MSGKNDKEKQKKNAKPPKENECRSMVLSSPRTVAQFLDKPTLVIQSHYGQISFDLATVQKMLGNAGTMQFPVQLQNHNDLSIVYPAATTDRPPKRPYVFSFQMAHSQSELLPSLDVVSDAGNVKTLLKMLFNPTAPVNMLVHKVGETILMDSMEELPSDALITLNAMMKYIQKNLPQTSFIRKHFTDTFQASDSDSYSLDTSFSTENPETSPQNNYKSTINSEYISSPDNDKMKNESIESALVPFKAKDSSTGDSLNECEHFGVQKPSVSTSYPKEKDNSIPSGKVDLDPKNFRWDFKDLHMLVGKDVPILGEGDYPCVSLKLNDVSKPINILTGLDYWLDNLMCNVPEIAMFFHNCGMIQFYECIKTEDLPNLENSKFNPELIKDVAQNIFTFIGKNTTHEGHTYWLTKSPDSSDTNEQVLLLYDLTAMMNNQSFMKDFPIPVDTDLPMSDANPFTVPIGLLFYRVARNIIALPLKNDSEQNRKKEKEENDATVVQCLLRCIKLLDSERFSDIVASAHYHIADIHLNRIKEGGCLSTSATNDRRYKKGKKKGQLDDISKQVASIRVGDLRQPPPKQTKKKSHFTLNYKPPRVSDDYIQCCLISYRHCIEGLKCTMGKPDQFTPSSETEKESEIPSKVQSEPKMAKANESIPLPYESLNGKKSPVFSNYVDQMTDAGDGSNDGVLASSVVPLNAKDLKVVFSNVTYTVKGWTLKLRASLLHTAADVHRKLSLEAEKLLLFDSAALHANLSVACCYAVCLCLGITSAGDVSLKPELQFSYLRDALIDAADVYIKRSIYLQREKFGGSAIFNDEITELNQHLQSILDSVMPPNYRSQFKMNKDEDDVLNCIQIALNFLSLAFGVPMKENNDQMTLDDFIENRKDPLNTGFWEDGREILAKIADFIVESANFNLGKCQEELFNNKLCDREGRKEILIRMKGVVPRFLSALRYYEAEHEVQKCAIVTGNIAKYHRVIAYFSDSSLDKLPFSAQEDYHYNQADQYYSKGIEMLRKVEDHLSKNIREFKTKKGKKKVLAELRNIDLNDLERFRKLKDNLLHQLIKCKAIEARARLDRPPIQPMTHEICDVISKCNDLINLLSPNCEFKNTPEHTSIDTNAVTLKLEYFWFATGSTISANLLLESSKHFKRLIDLNHGDPRRQVLLMCDLIEKLMHEYHRNNNRLISLFVLKTLLQYSNCVVNLSRSEDNCNPLLERVKKILQTSILATYQLIHKGENVPGCCQKDFREFSETLFRLEDIKKLPKIITDVSKKVRITESMLRGDTGI